MNNTYCAELLGYLAIIYIKCLEYRRLSIFDKYCDKNIAINVENLHFSSKIHTHSHTGAHTHTHNQGGKGGEKKMGENGAIILCC